MAEILKVGVIGTGMIGRDHIRRISEVLSGARVTAVTDVDRALAVCDGSIHLHRYRHPYSPVRPRARKNTENEETYRQKRKTMNN